MKIWKKIFSLMIISLFFGGCVLTKIVTIPMRTGGAAVSILPGVGNTAHDAIDEIAERIDDIPI